MKIILLKDVEKLGQAGDVADVSSGFARNFLIPKNLAMKATRGSMRQIENIKNQKASHEEKKRTKFQKLAEQLSGLSVDIPVEIGDEDQIFGTVSETMIADAVKEKGFEIDKKKIILEDPIKSLGVYNVALKLFDDIEPKIRVWVVRK
ncbi:MAG: 50S ribosomal protein L9 [Candidatus Zixiibacteriota bacterium]